VATQAVIETSHGPAGLALMREGRTAPEAVEARMKVDPHAHLRQLAMVDAHGGVGAYTGTGCMPHAGQEVGHHHSCQANLMMSEETWGAMSEAYRGASGSLARRMLAALDAAEALGGDLRGSQSAALLVVPLEGDPSTRVVDVRVDDHADPLGELRRLLRLNESYSTVQEGDTLSLAGDDAGACECYVAAMEGAPENDEIKFWAALSLIGEGETERGTALLRETIEAHPGRRRMFDLLEADMVPAVEQARRALAEGGGLAGGPPGPDAQGAGGTGPT
jgi:uncharacterized Ntn-hydrolase superfamily protein